MPKPIEIKPELTLSQIEKLASETEDLILRQAFYTIEDMLRLARWRVQELQSK